MSERTTVNIYCTIFEPEDFEQTTQLRVLMIVDEIGIGPIIIPLDKWQGHLALELHDRLGFGPKAEAITKGAIISIAREIEDYRVERRRKLS